MRASVALARIPARAKAHEPGTQPYTQNSRWTTVGDVFGRRGASVRPFRRHSQFQGGNSMKIDNSFGPNPRALRMFLAEKGITIPMRDVDLMAAENRRPPYTDRNPGGQL